MNWNKIGVAIGIVAMAFSFYNGDALPVFLVSIVVYAAIEIVDFGGRALSRWVVASAGYLRYSAKEDWKAWMLKRKQSKCVHPDTDVMFVYEWNADGEVSQNLRCRLCGFYPYPWWPKAKLIYPDISTGEPRGLF